MRSLLLLTLFISHSLFAQNFEGKIRYEVQYTSKLPSLKIEQLQSAMGTEVEYLIKNGSYKTRFNPGAIMEWQLYIHQEQKLYNQSIFNDTVLWNDVSVYDDSVISCTINKKNIPIAGYLCDELILNCKSGTQIYYFNAGIKADPLLFQNHQYGNWYAYLQQAKALPLKYSIQTPQYSMEVTATQVLPMKLEDALFTLPAGAKIAKSPF